MCVCESKIGLICDEMAAETEAAMVTGLCQSVFTSMPVYVREGEERKWTVKYFSSC